MTREEFVKKWNPSFSTGQAGFSKDLDALLENTRKEEFDSAYYDGREEGYWEGYDMGYDARANEEEKDV